MSSKLSLGTSEDSVAWIPPALGGAVDAPFSTPNWTSTGEPGADRIAAGNARIQQLESELAALRARIPDEKRVSYQEGLEQGSKAEYAKWAEALDKASKAIADLAGHKPRLRREVESDAVRLALAIARKVIRREMSVDPVVLTGLVRVAFDKVNSKDVLRIRTSPADAPELTRRTGQLGIPEQISIVGDPALNRGALILDTNRGQVDASVDTQLDEIERGLTDALDRSLS
jgi:flagellar assembly protein FliH